MGTPWTVDDTVAGNTPWKVDDTATPWTVDDTKKPLRGAGSVPRAEDPTFMGALGEMLVQAVPQTVGGIMESAGDFLQPGMRKDLPITKDTGIWEGAKALESWKPTFADAFVPEGGAIDQFGEWLSTKGAAMGDLAREKIQAEIPSDLNMLQQAGLSAAHSVTLMAPWLVAGRLGASPGLTQAGALGTFGTLSFGQTYNEAKAHGASPDDAFQAALQSGSMEVLTEMGAINTLLTGGSKWFGKFLVQEVGGEEIATISQSLFEKGLYNPEKWSSGEEILHDLAVTALAAGMGAGTLKGVDAGLDHFVGKREERNFEADAAMAMRELETTLAQAAAAGQVLPPEVVDGITQLPNITGDMTPAEVAEATIQREQLVNGLPAAPTAEGAGYAAGMRELLGAYGLASTVTPEERAEMELEQRQQEDEGGMTEVVLERRRRQEQLDSLPFDQLPISISTDGKTVGLTMAQTGELDAGVVVAVGADQAAFPVEVYTPVLDTIKQLVDKYMPDARVVLNLRQLSGGEFGAHVPFVNPATGNVTHIITPRELPSFIYQTGNVKTKMELITALTHEVGHALKVQNFFEGAKALGPVALAGLQKQIVQGQVDPGLMEAFRQVAPEEAALVGRWQEMRAKVLSGEMSALEFVETWVGTRKLGDSVLPTKKAGAKSFYSWAKTRLEAQGKSLEGASALELMQAAYGKEGQTAEETAAYALNFDEFMAEQFSRAAYTSGDVDRSPLGKFFARTMEQLRDLFRTLKGMRGENGEKIIAPDTTFQTWLDAQTARAKLMGVTSGKQTLSKKVTAAQKKLLAAKGLTPTGKPSKAKKKTVPPPPEIAKVQVDEKQVLTDMAVNLERLGEITPVQLEKFAEQIERGDLVRVRERLQRILGDDVNWDREYSSKVLSRLPDKKKILAATLKSTIAMQDVKAKERAMWEEFLLAHPEGFSIEEARDALERNVLPLEFVPTGEFATVGAWVLQQSLGEYEGANYFTAIWQNDYVRGGSSHFPYHPQYLMHSRRGDSYAGERFILELQSDLFQKEGRVEVGLNGQMEEGLRDAQSEVRFLRDWISDFEHLQGEDLLQEWKSARRVVSQDLGLPETPTPEGLETLISYLKTELEKQQNMARAGELVEQGLQRDEGQILDNVAAVRGNWWERLIREEIAQGVEDGVPAMYFPTAETVAKVEGWGAEPDGTFGEYQGIYNRYKGPVAKFLKSNYKAEQVDLNGVTWLKVNMQDKTNVVLNWERENPLEGMNPKQEAAAFAGMTPEQMRETGLVEGAVEMWERLGFESPYFKRWFGTSKVRDGAGQPLEVFRGTGGRVTFLDKHARGVNRAVSSAQKAFWFTDNVAGAQWYADYATRKGDRAIKEDFRRKAQGVYRQLAEAKELLEETPAGGKDWAIVQARVKRLTAEAEAFRKDEEKSQLPQPTVQGYFLRMENPLVVDLGGRAYDNELYTGYLEQALAGGHDGLVLRNTKDPLEGNVYALFEPENAKGSANVGTFSETDLLHWDRENPQGEQLRQISNKLEKLGAFFKAGVINGYWKTVQSLTQLQQLAAGRPDDFNLQTFLRRGADGSTLKNNLLKPAEDLVKELGQITGAGAERVQKLHDVLKAEEAAGKLAGPIHGLDSAGVEVWGEEAGMSREQQAEVVTWKVVDGPALREFLKKQGVDVTTEEGKELLRLYMQTRNLFLYQFTELGKKLSVKAGRTYANTPAVAKQELIQIQDLMAKLLTSPFVPQGNFGKYVLIVKEDRGPVPFGQRRMKVVLRQHFESKAKFDQAYMEAQRLKGGNLRVEVSSKVLEDPAGIPFQLPAEFLERAEMTGEFSPEQLQVMEELMVSTKYSKIAEKYAKMSSQVKGGSDDFVRVLADFASRNANYIWKAHSRHGMQQAISSAKLRIRRLEKQPGAMTVEGKAELDASRRAVELMQSSLNYMMNPPQEMQGMRSFITLVYLAYNVKTALMNLSTVMNTWAATTSEYGELQGNKEFFKSTKQVGELLLHKSRLGKVEREGGVLPTVEGQEMNELVGVLDKALTDGVVDQSFAYFLAAHADSTPLLAATKGKSGQIANAVSELGMLPFQTIEKVNRIHSLITFYKLERKAGTQPQEAYLTAVAKTNQLQNSYEAMNRPELFRGTKAIFTMFMSYVQFMGWITTGGYERGARKAAELQGRTVAPRWRGTTAKIWLLYLLLGGLMGVPFARNVMDVVQWLWRKLGFGNAEAELRIFLEEMGLDSNWAIHGLMHDVAGFDVSASFGLGRMLPGTDILTKTRDMNATETMGSLLLMSSGPAGSFYKSVIESLGELTAGNFTEAGKKMPGAVGAVSKAVDAHLRQEMRPTYGVTTRDGRRLTWDEERGEFRDLTTKELMGMLLNFNPNILAENRARDFAMQSEMYYWQGRRSDLMDRYWQAVRSGDEKLRVEVLKAHEDFNKQAPDRKLWITSKTRAESLRTHKKQVRAAELHGTKQKMYRGVVQGVEQAYGKGGEG